METLRTYLAALLLLAGIVAGPAWAQPSSGPDAAAPATEESATPRFSASVRQNEITLQEPLRLTLAVRDSDGSEPELPSIPDFEIVSRGRSSQIRILNNQAETTVQFNYLLMPRGTGTFTIPPATLVMEGQTYTTEPITVRVVEAAAQPVRNNDLFTTAEVSTSEPWQGQQVIYTWRLFQRVRFYDGNLQLPEFEGFLVEVLDQKEQWLTTLNGQQYVVSERSRALFPQGEGELTIGPAMLRGQVEVGRADPRERLFGSVFGRSRVEPRNFLTDPISVRVRPLPPAPTGFSGLVGRFQLEARLSKQQLAVGESATLTLTIRGEGNAQMIPEPRLPDLPEFKIYDDKPSREIQRKNDGLSGSRTFRKALVPLTPGTHSIPAVTLTYFDPAAGRYRTQSTPELTLEVSPGQGEEALHLTQGLTPAGGKVAVRILGDDILPIHRDLDVVERRDRSTLWMSLFSALFLTPPAIFGLLVMVDRRRRQRAGERQRREARQEALERLEGLDPQADPATRADAMSQTVRRFIGDSLGVEGGALTATEAALHLQGAGVEPSLAVRAEEMLSRLEAIQYGAAGGDAVELRNEVESLLNRLDEALP